jgi:hypothetical protein
VRFTGDALGNTARMDETRSSGRTLDDEGVPDLEGPLPEKAATGDPQEGIAPPADHPASLDYGTTAAEQRAGEPLDIRLSHELPDFGDDDVPAQDDVVQAVRVEDEDIGRIDDEKDEVARAVAPGAEGLSAEEAALHVEQP